MAPTKITHFTSISAIDQGVLLLWLIDVTMCKMMSMNLVETYGVANDVLELQSKTKKGKKIIADEERVPQWVDM